MLRRSPPLYRLPFSHKAGFFGWIPSTHLALRSFPTALELYEWGKEGLIFLKRICFPRLGTPSKWTCFFDPIRRHVQVEGIAKDGFFRYRITVEKNGLILRSLKGKIVFTIEGQEVQLAKKEPFTIHGAHFKPIERSRLDLGINKSPNWHAVTGRQNILEIIQHWYHIATPSSIPSLSSNSLLGQVVDAVQRADKTCVLDKIYDFYRAGISDFFVPKKEDDLFLGYDLPLFDNPVADLHGILTACIRALFIREREGKIELLPCLPKEIASGRLFQGRFSHTIDMEWRKGKMRRLCLHAEKEDSISFVSKASTCFVRKNSLKAKKEPHLLKKELEVQAGNVYLLDNFT